MSIQIRSQHLAEVLSVLLAPPSVGCGSEKRRATRIQVEAPVTIWPVTDGSSGAAITVLTRDLSYTGVGLLQAIPTKAGDQFILRLPRPKNEPILVLCKVTFVRLLADNLHAVGALFVSFIEHPKTIHGAAAPAAPPTPVPPAEPLPV